MIMAVVWSCFSGRRQAVARCFGICTISGFLICLGLAAAALCKSTSSSFIAEPQYSPNDSNGLTARIENSVILDRYALEWKSPSRTVSDADILSGNLLEFSPTWITLGRKHLISGSGRLTPIARVSNGIPDHLQMSVARLSPANSWIFCIGFPFRFMSIGLPLVQFSDGPTEFYSDNYSKATLLQASALWFIVNIGIASALVYMLLWLLWVLRAIWRQRRELCVVCGYDLSVSPRGKCPECGVERPDLPFSCAKPHVRRHGAVRGNRVPFTEC